jgi:hypothetical protein
MMDDKRSIPLSLFCIDLIADSLTFMLKCNASLNVFAYLFCPTIGKIKFKNNTIVLKEEMWNRWDLNPPRLPTTKQMYE